VIVIDPFDSLGKVDVILVTHGHGDHTGDVSELAKAHGRDRARPCRAHRDGDRSRPAGARATS
jgi:glyoxylase-like metal-dependent hydrolase (beta-lactamase superfamily II)